MDSKVWDLNLAFIFHHPGAKATNHMYVYRAKAKSKVGCVVLKNKHDSKANKNMYLFFYSY